MDDDERALSSLVSEAKALFYKAYAGATPTTIVASPGRVNLIGEHTDYNEGFVMPLAINRATLVAAAKRPKKADKASSATVRLISSAFPEISTFDIKPGDTTLPRAGDWTDYVRGVVAQYLPSLPQDAAGIDLAIVANLPLGSGLSSSASLEVGVATALEAMFRISLPVKDKALRCQKCEHDYCDTPCGIMDQFIVACGEAGHALLIDCRPPFRTEQVPLDNPNVALVVANSNVKHKLSGSEYPERVQQCKEAAAAMGVTYLRDASLKQLEAAASASRLVSRALTPKVVSRARHVITEDQRVLDARDALRAGNLARVGKLMRASHDSLRDDFEVSTPELDALVDIAMGVDGVYGSRMTGGGFGGCTITLVDADAVPALLAAIEEQYPLRTGGKSASCFVTRPSDGAAVLQHGVGAKEAAALGGGGGGAGCITTAACAAVAVGAAALGAAAAATFISARRR